MPEHKRILTAYYSSKELKKREDSIENVTHYEHPQVKFYLTQQHWSSGNSSISTKTTASIHTCKELHQTNPLIITFGKQPKY
jgi:hypothetical protein